MTEDEARVRRAISTIEDAFPSGIGSWSRKRRNAWIAALDDLNAADVENAALRLVREWSDDRGRTPFVGHVRELALIEQKARARPRPLAGLDVDRAALIDARAMREAILDGRSDLLTLAEIDAQSAAIRARL